MDKKQHGRYYAIPAYQILANMSDREVAKALGISVRTYKNKISGLSDFTSEQGRKLGKLFNTSQDNLFLTRECVELETPDTSRKPALSFEVLIQVEHYNFPIRLY